MKFTSEWYSPHGLNMRQSRGLPIHSTEDIENICLRKHDVGASTFVHGHGHQGFLWLPNNYRKSFRWTSWIETRAVGVAFRLRGNHVELAPDTRNQLVKEAA